MKDNLEAMGKHMRNEVFEDLLASETMKGMTPVRFPPSPLQLWATEPTLALCRYSLAIRPT